MDLLSARFPVWDMFLPLPNSVTNAEATSSGYVQVLSSRQHAHVVELRTSGPVLLYEGVAAPTDDVRSTWVNGVHARIVEPGRGLWAKSLVVSSGGDDSGGDDAGTHVGFLTFPTTSIGEVTVSDNVATEGGTFLGISGDGAASVEVGLTFFFDGEPDSEHTIVSVVAPGAFVTISPGVPFVTLPSGYRMFFGVDAEDVPRSSIATKKSRYNVFGENDPLVGATSMTVTGLTTADDSGLDEILVGMCWRSTVGDATVYTISEVAVETDPQSSGRSGFSRDYVRMTFSPGLVQVPTLIAPLMFAPAPPTLSLRAAAAADVGDAAVTVDGLGVDQLAATQKFTVTSADGTEYTVLTVTPLTGADEGKTTVTFSPVLTAAITDNSGIVFTGEGISGIPDPTETGANTVGDPAPSASVNVDGDTADLVVGAAITFGDRLDDNLVFVITATRAQSAFPGGNGKTLTVDPPLTTQVSNDTVVYLYVYPPPDDGGGEDPAPDPTPTAGPATVSTQVWSSDVRFPRR